MRRLYSSLYDYTAAVNGLTLTWELEEDTDFFNYQSAAHAWWTGYFTSRPDLKSYGAPRALPALCGAALRVYRQPRFVV